MKTLLYIIMLSFLTACNQSETGNQANTNKPNIRQNSKEEDRKVMANTNADDIPGINIENKDTSVIETKAIDKDVEIPNGPVVLLYPNGNKKVEGSNKNKKRHGTWKAYYENGQLWSISSYVEGVENGIKTTYYPNGAVHYVGEYINGKQVGIWKFYDENGKLTEQKFD